jgi:hypothetical protein
VGSPARATPATTSRDAGAGCCAPALPLAPGSGRPPRGVARSAPDARSTGLGAHRGHGCWRVSCASPPPRARPGRPPERRSAPGRAPLMAPRPAPRASAGRRWAGPVARHGLREGRVTGTPWLVGLALAPRPRAPRPARHAGAQAPQACAREAPPPRLGRGGPLAPPPSGPGPGRRPLPGPLGAWTEPASREGRQAGARGLGEGRAGGAGDRARGPAQRAVGRRGLRAAWTPHPLQARPQGDALRGMALLAAGGQGEPLRLLPPQGQGARAHGSARRRVAATRWQASAAVAGRHAGRGGRGGRDPTPRAPGAGRAPPRQPRLLAGGQGALCTPIQRLPAALTAHRRGGRGPHTGPPRALGPRGAGPLACGPGRTRAGRQPEGGPHGPRGASPWRGGRDGSRKQRTAPQGLGPRLAQRRGPALPGRHGVERGPGPVGGSGSPWDTAGRQDALLRPQRARLDQARLALDTGGADPGESRSALFPRGHETGHTARGIPPPVDVQCTLLKLQL